MQEDENSPGRIRVRATAVHIALRDERGACNLHAKEVTQADIYDAYDDSGAAENVGFAATEYFVIDDDCSVA
jgi:hypothetical protein